MTARMKWWDGTSHPFRATASSWNLTRHMRNALTAMSSSAEVRLWTMSTIAQKGTSKEKTRRILREVEGTPMEEGEEETVLVALPMEMEIQTGM